MMKRIMLSLGILLLPCISHGAELRIVKSDILGFEIIQRNHEDRYYSITICSANGWKEFKTIYAVKKEYMIPDFSGEILIVGLNDRMSEKVTGLIYNKKTRKYFIDYADSGKKYKMRLPNVGKKYTGVTIIKANLDCSIYSHVGVRRMGGDGLSKQLK
jgi:hypothetical protein